ncbi:hypothetical protein FHT80_005749 [Rhizobium sp. BK226]|nr:hypothetical protein [Rhizobium sp. BK226]
MEPLLRNGGIIHQSIGFADLQICRFLFSRIRGKFGVATATPRTSRRATGMKKPSSKIREEIARLQDQLRAAETREAERIGRIALKAGIGEIEIEEAELQAAFEGIAGRFRGGREAATGRKNASGGRIGSEATSTLTSGANAGGAGEA